MRRHRPRPGLDLGREAIPVHYTAYWAAEEIATFGFEPLARQRLRLPGAPAPCGTMTSNPPNLPRDQFHRAADTLGVPRTRQ